MTIRAAHEIGMSPLLVMSHRRIRILQRYAIGKNPGQDIQENIPNSQPLDLWKLSNTLLQMGENAIISREVYDLKTAILDPTFTPQLVPVT